MRKPMLFLLAAPVLVLFVVPFALPGRALSPQQTAAPAPTPPPASTSASGVNLVNPVKATPESQARAKKVYGYDCALCHGVNGNGKGDLVGDLKLTLKDYTDPAALKGMSDGELYTIIKDGKGQMPPEGDRGKLEDMWNLVILVRSFAKKADVAGAAPAAGAVRP
jgi:mono/diheme cytochrome c family protein